jgi:hypothetical protein
MPPLKAGLVPWPSWRNFYYLATTHSASAPICHNRVGHPVWYQGHPRSPCAGRIRDHGLDDLNLVGSVAVMHITEEFAFPGGFAEGDRMYRAEIRTSITRRFHIIINAALLVPCWDVAITGMAGVQLGRVHVESSVPQEFAAAFWLAVAGLLFSNRLVPYGLQSVKVDLVQGNRIPSRNSETPAMAHRAVSRGSYAGISQLAFAR